MYEQQLMYGGKQLQYDQTLGDCHVVNDAMVNLVTRMLSTTLPQSWKLINDFMYTIRSMCRMGEQVPNVKIKLSHLQDSIRNEDGHKDCFCFCFRTHAGISAVGGDFGIDDVISCSIAEQP